MKFIDHTIKSYGFGLEKQRGFCRTEESYSAVYKLLLLTVFLLVVSGCEKKQDSKVIALPYSKIKPRVIHLDLPAKDEGVGGIITVDADDDGERDFIVTKLGHIAVCSLSGERLWSRQVNIQVTRKSESYGLPGWHAPGVQAADLNGDQETEVLFLTKEGTLQILRGANGEVIRDIRIQSPQGTKRWEHLVVANFRGKGDRDLLLQTTNAAGYRMGSHLAAYALEDLMKGKTNKPLWTRNNFIACAHNGARVADLDGDGKDEVLGGTVLGPDGSLLFQIPLRGHIDSIFAADVRPEISGLEVVSLEEGGEKRIFNDRNRVFRLCNRIFDYIVGGGNRVFLYNHKGLIWESRYEHREPQNAAVGEFDRAVPGLEIWCRSRFNEHQKPFVFNAKGQVIAGYEMDDVAPDGWTSKGIEVIFPISWTSDSRQLAAAKERHKSGDVAIFDPISGRFLYRFKESADRLYAADVCGDWREEVIVLNGNEIHVYQNGEENPDPDRPRLWTQPHYRRCKMTWNYYSP